jgi:pimeloyl-ACP methyl ester carboxylesterase
VSASGSESESDGSYYVRRLSYKNYRDSVSGSGSGSVSEEATSQYWWFTGGPGQDGSEYEVSAAKMAALSLTDDPDYAHLRGIDHYIPDHRGAGKSTYLGCPNQTHEDSPGGIYLLDEETIPCLTHLLNTWGPRLSLFSTSNAARDARYVMKNMTAMAANPITFKTTIYGGSYGTLLANRILQMEGIESEPILTSGQLVSKAILDGVVAPDMYHVKTQLYSGTSIAQIILSACASTTSCTDFLGSDPVQFVFDLLDDVANGWCSSFNVTTDDIKLSFGSYPSLTNSIISPVMLVNRVRECNPSDADNVKFYIDYLHAAIIPAYQEGFKPPAGSFPLLYNVMFGEQTTLSAPVNDEPPFLQAYGLESDKKQLGLLYDHMLVLSPQAMWPRYRDDYSSKYPDNITAEILILHGGADSNTPIAYGFHAYNQLAKIAHTVNRGGVSLPRIITYTPAGHVILYKTPSNAAVKCVSFFLDSPINPGLDSCMPLDSIQSLFENPPAVDMYLFQYPSSVFTEKYSGSQVTSLQEGDCDCINADESLTQASIVALVSFLTLVLFLFSFWFLALGPALGHISASASASNNNVGDVKNPISGL